VIAADDAREPDRRIRILRIVCHSNPTARPSFSNQPIVSAMSETFEDGINGEHSHRCAAVPGEVGASSSGSTSSATQYAGGCRTPRPRRPASGSCPRSASTPTRVRFRRPTPALSGDRPPGRADRPCMLTGLPLCRRHGSRRAAAALALREAGAEAQPPRTPRSTWLSCAKCGSKQSSRTPSTSPTARVALLGVSGCCIGRYAQRAAVPGRRDRDRFRLRRQRFRGALRTAPSLRRLTLG
jgi:hypothetical protein